MYVPYSLFGVVGPCGGVALVPSELGGGIFGEEAGLSVEDLFNDSGLSKRVWSKVIPARVGANQYLQT
jgi:hypothetical protein